MNTGIDLERACEVMHDAYEKAAVGAGWETQQASRKPWADVPEANKFTMRAAVGALLDHLAMPSESAEERLNLRTEIQVLLNRHSRENQSGTPDFVLAQYLFGALENFEGALAARDSWWSFDPKIGGVTPARDGVGGTRVEGSFSAMYDDDIEGPQ